MTTANAQITAFRKLHAGGCFVIPNPWNPGTAKYLRHLGFRALATTSAGYAFAQGLPDGAVSRDDMLTHISEIVEATDVPVNADYGTGFADEPEQVAQNVKKCIATGVAGLSIEDATGDASKPLYEFSLAVERIRAARAAIDESGSGVLLTGRAECYLVRHPDAFAESIRRLQAYKEAGADVLYAPGVSKREEMQEIVSAAAPKPVNILIGADLGLRVFDLEAMGVRRISVGGALARSAWTAFAGAAKPIAEQGSFAGLTGLMSHPELNRLFATEER
ncbi:MAG TPA: isocitrate lyase/phosphoenolpyruvate mutase family protein [Bryobacteraceae bacterium]